MLNITLRKKARQFSTLVRHSAMTRRQGDVHKPIHAAPHELGLTFIGHSGFFVQIAGRNVVIDPNFARWIFVLKRLRRPGLRIADLPAIDYVLVTHAHFDHLHRPALRAIARHSRRIGYAAPTIIVPHHVRDLVEDLGFHDIIELEWWQTHSADGATGELQITHVPSQHWGARMIKDFHRGYGGYVLQSDTHSVYHAGDTAYFGGFREIGERLAPRVALMPIGAYNPESFRAVHTSPEDALQGFLDLGADVMIPMHYGTFKLSHEPMDEPVPRLLQAADAAGVRERMLVLQEGRTRIL